VIACWLMRAPTARTATEREQQALLYVFEGLANKEIADRIGVSESSIEATMEYPQEGTS
jgi:DNA-binding NarL/FixJ family response regulator